ncbi:MAG: hypothetical protein HY557_05260 [Euryarchaeota archaeon]|nr:hypothetical protein [Euryarchaeota archaeon]
MAKSTGKVRRRIDRRNWTKYNRWQSEEVRLACLFLKTLAESSTIHDWERRRGRPRIPRRELVLCLLVRSYFHLSFRRTVGLLKLLQPTLGLARVSHFNTLQKYNRGDGITRTLEDLLAEAAHRFSAVEKTLAVEATGLVLFGSGAWRANHDPEARRDFAKVHVLSGTATTATLTGTPGAAGWFTSAVAVTLTAIDATSGVSMTVYAIDGGQAQPYAGPFLISGDGTHSLIFSSIDAAGNPELTQEIFLQIDTTPPATTIDISGTAGTNGWWRSAVSVTLTATDAESGVAMIHYRLDSGQLTDYAAPFNVLLDGVHTLEVFAEDNAGNLEPLQTVEVKVDRTAPTLILTEPVSESNVTEGDVTVRWSPADTTSGVGACTVSLDGDPPAATTGTSHTLSDVAVGTHTVTVVCTDVAGNSAEQSSTFHVRAAPPPPPPTGLHPAIAVAIIAAVVLALGIIALLKGRKKKEPEEKDE